MLRIRRLPLLAAVLAVAVVAVVVALLAGGDDDRRSAARPASAAAGPFTRRLSAASPFARCAVGTRAMAGYEAEPSLGLDPRDARHLVAVWQQDRLTRGARGLVAADSRDGGASWSAAPVPRISRCSGGRLERASDPWVALGADGSALLASVAFTPGRRRAEARSDIVVSRSADGGRRWAAPRRVSGPGPNDKPVLAADPRRPGRAVVVWSRLRRAATSMVAVTADGGRRWSAPRPIPGARRVELGHQLVFTSGGTLVDVVATPAGRGRRGFQLIARRSGDEGRTWSRAIAIGRLGGRSARDPGRGRPIRAPTWLSSAAAGPGDAVVVAWVDIRSPRRALVRAVRSGDGGRRFGAPVTLARIVGQAFVPGVAVAGDGTIGVSYDAFVRRAGRGAGLATSLFLATSTDEGLSWRRTRISGPFDVRRASTGGAAFVGDYQGMAGLPDGFAALFARPGVARGRGRTDVLFAVCRAPGGQAIC